MTPPIRMVSVPVEPTEAMMLAADAVDWNNEDERAAVINMWQTMISVAAARAPEGGAVGVKYDPSDVRYGLHLIANEDCDEVAASYYAKKALAHLAAPVREEGGAGDYTMALAERQPFEAHPALAAHIERMAVGRSVGSLIEWDAFLRDLNAALATREEAPADCPHEAYEVDSAGQPVRCSDCNAPAEAGEERFYRRAAKIIRELGPSMSPGALAATCERRADKEALRAQPHAREEARTDLVAIQREQWVPCSREWLDKHPNGCAEAPRVAAKEWDGHSHYHPANWPTPPAPEAEKLRVAVERLLTLPELERRQQHLRKGIGTATDEGKIVLNALAALQQDTRPGEAE